MRSTGHLQGQLGRCIDGFAPAVQKEKGPGRSRQQVRKKFLYPGAQLQLRRMAHDVGDMQDLLGLLRDGGDDLGVVVAAGMDGDAAREVDKLPAAIGGDARALACQRDGVGLKADDLRQRILREERMHTLFRQHKFSPFLITNTCSSATSCPSALPSSPRLKTRCAGGERKPSPLPLPLSFLTVFGGRGENPAQIFPFPQNWVKGSGEVGLKGGRQRTRLYGGGKVAWKMA